MSLGRIERALGRRAEALAAFRGAHGAEPGNPYPLIEMATETRALAEPEQARLLLLQALERDPRNLQAIEQLGEAARLAQDYEAALARFAESRGINPASPWAWLGAARTLSNQGRQAEAAAMLDAAEERCGPLPEIEAGRIDLLRQRGDWPAALERARAASAAAPGHAGLWVHRFRMERMLATPAELEACLADAPAATVQDRARLHHFRGQAAEERWDLAGAIAAYERAMALRPDDAWTLGDLVRARILALDLDAAQTGLERQVRLTASVAMLEGRSTNPSQTHSGQILDEFRLDGAALAELTAIGALAPEARVEPLRRLVTRFPDYTPAAMMLLIALRQAGMLAAPQEQAGTSAIPRRIAQYWDSPEPPAELAALMQGWREAHPDHEVRRLDDAAARAFLRETCPPDVLAAYRRAREPAQKADIFRLAWLFAEGGWWLDADDRCLAPLGSVAAPGAGLVLYQEDYGTVGNNVIGAVPQHPVIGLALDLAVSAINRGDADILWFSTGPGLLTRALARVLAGPQLTLAAWLRRVQVLPRAAMHRAVAMHCQVAYKTTDRHWSRTAFARRRQAARETEAG
jgi:mannosyltransferase OCH1-like enzyme